MDIPRERIEAMIAEYERQMDALVDWDDFVRAGGVIRALRSLLLLQPTEAIQAHESLLSEVDVERRLYVHGWKMESGKVRHFTESTPLYVWSSVDYQTARIGQPDLADWQPHITGIDVEERNVSPWRVIHHVGDEANNTKGT